MNNLNNIVGEIAQRHGIRLQEDDPVLILDTVLKQFENHIEAMQQQHRQAFLSLLEAEQEKWNLESKKRADRVLTAALEASKQATRELLTDNVNDVEKTINKAMTSKITFLEQQYTKVYQIAIANMFAAGLLAFASMFLFFLQ